MTNPPIMVAEMHWAKKAEIEIPSVKKTLETFIEIERPESSPSDWACFQEIEMCSLIESSKIAPHISRPARCQKRRYKFRLERKWFNRYQKEHIMSLMLSVNASNFARVTEAKLTKQGLAITARYTI